MKKNTLIIALFLLAISGFLLHYRVHPFLTPDKVSQGAFIFNKSNFLASLFSLIDAVVVTSLFLSRKTAVFGYLLNGLIVIFGTILMAHFSIVDIIAKSIPVTSWLTRSTLPDIGIAWADFLVGKSLYDLYLKQRVE
jgi:branched-subunit amino acid permease